MSELPNLPHEPLSLVEARILGCLIEKETTTPDLYPLTLNSLVNACNQKSNRHPIMDLDEEAVHAALESLRAKRLALLVTQTNARVAKYKHSLENVYPLPNAQVAILAELLLRGPQTIGELRTRCSRMADMPADLAGMRAEIDLLSSGDFPILKELPRQSGKKDARFAQLLTGEPALDSEESDADSRTPLKVAVALPPEAETRIADLESQITELKSQVSNLETQLAAQETHAQEQTTALASLRQELADFRAQFE